MKWPVFIVVVVALFFLSGCEEPDRGWPDHAAMIWAESLYLRPQAITCTSYNGFSYAKCSVRVDPNIYSLECIYSNENHKNCYLQSNNK